MAKRVIIGGLLARDSTEAMGIFTARLSSPGEPHSSQRSVEHDVREVVHVGG
jgi:hypothetical protein